MSELFISIETNGIGSYQPSTQRILRVSWIYNDIHNSDIIQCNHKINPNVGHNIRTKDTANGKDFYKVFTKLWNDMNDCSCIVGHNVFFCIDTILNELKQRKSRYHQIFKTKIKSMYKADMLYCTMKNSVRFCNIATDKGLKFPTLEELEKKIVGEIQDDVDKVSKIKDIYETLINLKN